MVKNLVVDALVRRIKDQKRLVVRTNKRERMIEIVERRFRFDSNGDASGSIRLEDGRVLNIIVSMNEA